MSLLVVGAGGFLGRAVARAALERGEQVLGWTREPARLPRGVAAARVDLLRDDAPEVPDGVRAIILLSGHAVPGADDGERLARESLFMCARVVERARRARDLRRLVYASSSHVYAPSSEPHVEDEPPAPANAYGAGKLACERLCVDAGGEVVLARLFGSCGPGLPRGLMLTDALESAVRDLRATKDGAARVRMRGPDAWRDLLALEDAAEALVACASHPAGLSGAVHVASCLPRRSSQLVATMMSALPGRIVVDWPAGEGPAQLAVARRLRVEAGWKPRHDLDSALRAMASAAWNLRDEGC